VKEAPPPSRVINLIAGIAQDACGPGAAFI